MRTRVLSGIENLAGSTHDDQLTGDDGDNWIQGSNGNDVLTGGLGMDTLIGGNGDDRLYWDDSTDTDIFDGGDGYDRMNVGSVMARLDTVSGVEEVIFTSDTGSLLVDAALVGDLERITASASSTVQLATADGWTAGTSDGNYTLYTASGGAQLWIDDEAVVQFV